MKWMGDNTFFIQFIHFQVELSKKDIFFVAKLDN